MNRRATDAEVHALWVALAPFARPADPAWRITPTSPRLAAKPTEIPAQPRPAQVRRRG